MTQEVTTKEDRNRAIIRRFYDEIVNQRNLATIEEIFDSNIVDHNADMKTDLEFVLSDGDYVVARLSVSGTHTAEFKPIPTMPQGIPPSHEKFRTTATEIYRLRDGRITDVWPELDMLSLMTQIKAEGS